MTLQALPDYIDITDSVSNLAAYDDFSSSNQAALFDDGALDGNILRMGPLEDYRLLWGEDLAALLAMGAHGYMRSGGNVWHALLWGLAGYMAPLPTTGVAVLQTLTDASAQRPQWLLRSAG